VHVIGIDVEDPELHELLERHVVADVPHRPDEFGRDVEDRQVEELAIRFAVLGSERDAQRAQRPRKSSLGVNENSPRHRGRGTCLELDRSGLTAKLEANRHLGRRFDLRPGQAGELRAVELRALVIAPAV